MWLKFLHKTLTLVFRKSCSSITVTSAHLDFFHCFKLHLTSIFKEDSKSDCNTEHDVACIKAKVMCVHVMDTLPPVSIQMNNFPSYHVTESKCSPGNIIS